MNIATKPLHDINIKAITLLNGSLGIADTIRFLNQFTTGFGVYSEQKEHMFKNVTLEKIITEIKELRMG